jgi:hypothetical protein
MEQNEKEQKEELQKKVLQFVQKQPGYTHQELKVMCDKTDFFILYGGSLKAGIAGFGTTPECAFDDFMASWHRAKGEKWIEMNL